KKFDEMCQIRQSGSDPRPGTGVRPQFDLVEAGAGSGRLARDILDAAQKHQPDFYSAIRLSLVEQSHTAREAQRRTLGAHAGLLADGGAVLPADVHRVIYAHELLDAL